MPLSTFLLRRGVLFTRTISFRHRAHNTPLHASPCVSDEILYPHTVFCRCHACVLRRAALAQSKHTQQSGPIRNLFATHHTNITFIKNYFISHGHSDAVPGAAGNSPNTSRFTFAAMAAANPVPSILQIAVVLTRRCQHCHARTQAYRRRRRWRHRRRACKFRSLQSR